MGGFLLVVSILLALWCLLSVAAWWRERSRLRSILVSLNGQVRIRELADLVRIKGFLNEHIHFDIKRRHDSRPLLRHTATQILDSQYGFCGENARVANLMLNYGGVRSNRIYLVARNWQHVAVEQKWEGEWWYFDGHVEKMLPFEDADVARIPSSDSERFPNQYGASPITDVSRIKLFRSIPGLRGLASLRLPSLLVVIFESPELIKAILALFLSLSTLALYLSLNA